jgi:hypothetical protein
MLGNIVAGTFSTGAPPAPPNSYESIATVTVGSGGSSTISFTSIPSTYKHLQVRYNARAGRANDATGYMWLQVNTVFGDRYHVLNGNGSAANALGAVPAFDSGQFLNAPGTSAAANIFGAGVIDFLDYGSTTKNKTIRALSGVDCNGSGYIGLSSYLYGAATTAISSITIGSVDSNVGALLQQHSHFALYGIKD